MIAVGPSSEYGGRSGAQWLVVSRVPIRTTIKTGGQSGSVSGGQSGSVFGGGW